MTSRVLFNLFFAFCLTAASAQTELLNIDFSTDTTSEWTPVGDATSGDASIRFDSTGGNAGGAMEISGTNSAGGVGRSYIWSLDFTVDPLSSADIIFSFDMKVTTALSSSAVHFLTSAPVVGANLFDIQNQGLNATDWISVTHTVTGVGVGATSVNMQFQIAAGAVSGAGAGILIDNIVVQQVPEPSTYAAILSLLVLGFVVVKRRK